MKTFEFSPEELEMLLDSVETEKSKTENEIKTLKSFERVGTINNNELNEKKRYYANLIKLTIKLL